MNNTKRITADRPRIVARGPSAPLIVAIDRRTKSTLSKQIYASIRASIMAGRLAPGARLPPTRDLADEIGVSRTIVVIAYERLATEGYVTTSGGAGSFVAHLSVARAAERRTNRLARGGPRAQSPGRTLVVPAEFASLPNLRSAATAFRIGEPAVDLFPILLWSRLYARRARRAGSANLLHYGLEGGYRPLRSAIAAYVSAARGVNAAADQVLLTRGTQQAIDLIGRVLITPGDAVWVEDPGYLAARTLFTVAGAELVPVPLDKEGIVVGEGTRLAPQARLAYVSPSHQFPLGATLSLQRRLALLDWAAHTNAWIVEDDYDSEFRYGGAPMASLQGLDTMNRVIYSGTFSKTVFPSLRLGYLILPPALIGVFRNAQSAFDLFTPSLEQATLAEFIEGGYFTRHVRTMRATYAARQAALLRGIERELPGLVDSTPASTGMHVVAWLRDQSLDDKIVSRLAREAGVEVSPLSMYSLKAKLRPALLMGFAATKPGEIRGALRTLATILRTLSAH